MCYNKEKDIGGFNMRNIKFAKGSFIVEKTMKKKGRFYWTVINTKPPNNPHISAHMFHCHVCDARQINAAKMLCIWAHKIQSGKVDKWPYHYPVWMQRGLSRLLYGDLDAYKHKWIEK